MDTGLPEDDIDHNTHSSVVLHVDLDCFYAAVEHVRLGIPREVPLAVQQWEGLIAINYAARAAGITRHERVHQAMRKCPELKCVHVETIGDGSGNVDGTSRGHAKVSLERYRQASANVFKIFRRFSDLCEKASIDEAYLDVTSRVEKMMIQGCNWDQELHRLIGNQEEGSEMIVLDGPLVPFNSYDRRMLAGAIIAEKIRAAVRSELGYTCSVGIATNKLLAKIASAKNKPDKQTLVPPRAVPYLMQSMPLRKVKLLGGKLGEEMTEKWGVSTAGEAQAVPLPALVGCFGERLGNYVWNAVRGIQNDKVQVKQVSKSMLAAKTFHSTKELSDIRMWLSILAEELSVRMLRDFEQNHRHPRLLQLYYRSGDFKHSRDHTKSWSMPHAALSLLSAGPEPSYQATENPKHYEDQELRLGEDHGLKVDLFHEESLPFDREHHYDEDDAHVDEDSHGEHSKDLLGLVVSEKSRSLAKVLGEASFNMFRRLEGTFPCSRLALAAGGFHELPAQGTKSIQHFFTSIGRGKTSPLENALSNEHKERKPLKAKPKAKGMLKFFKYEEPSVILEERCQDAVEHWDNLPDGRHVDRKDQSALFDTTIRASRPKSKGLHKFLSHENRTIQEVGSGKDFKDLDKLHDEIDSNKLKPSNEATDLTGVQVEATGGRLSSAFATELDIYQAKELFRWIPDREVDHLSGSVATGKEDEIRDHHREWPGTGLHEKVEPLLATSGGENTCERSCHMDVGELDMMEQSSVLATRQRPNQQPTILEQEARAEVVATPVKSSSEPSLKQKGQSKGFSVPIPAKRHRLSTSKRGQQSISKFFRTQDKA
ncbi:hypothetical protein AXG93_3902s1030 [Marchantia polymorpha subsp. ruderalis]|nr:hypothetical protein AXG93_3902s1030 [Marchantia polymorpha subsp. ruderalis]